MATVAGYALQDKNGNEIQRMQSIPNPMLLPNGDQVCGAAPGWSDGGYSLVPVSWDVPDAPPMPIPPISDRQFFQALALSGSITQTDALAAVKTGTLPPQLQDAINAMPPDQQFSAEMMLSGATAFDRNHPMTDAMMQVLGWDAASTDELWKYAATL